MNKNTKTFLSICLGIVLFLSGSLLSIARELEPKGEEKSDRHFFLPNDDDDDSDKWPEFDEMWEADYQACIDECRDYAPAPTSPVKKECVELVRTDSDFDPHHSDLDCFGFLSAQQYYSCVQACKLIYNHD